MNREIKFRAWDNENKYMITSKQGIFTALRNSMNITVQDNGYYNNGDLLKPNKEKYTLMQYTGLKDKNGVEIYEGDIVRYHHKTFFKKKGEKIYDFKNEKCYVVWDIEDAGFCLSKSKDKITNKTFVDLLYMMEDDCMEIIGNIYENEVD